MKKNHSSKPDVMQKNKPATIDDYIASQPGDAAEGLQQLRRIIQSTAPAAKEMISYGMPAFQLHGMLVGFANWKNHIGFYPWNSSTVKAFAEQLQDYQTSKGAIQFPKNKKLPVSLIRKIVRARIADNIAKEKLKKEKKKK